MSVNASINLHNTIFSRLMTAPIAFFDINPIDHLSTTINGLVTIRALRAEKHFTNDFNRLQDNHTTCYFTNIAANRALGLVLELIYIFYETFVVIFLMLFTDDISGGTAGLLLFIAINMSWYLQIMVRRSADLETYMTSVERILDYSHLESEVSESGDSCRPPAPDWPHEGRICLNHVSLKYDNATDPTLVDINCEIKGGERVGIVGRTGAGKSSLLAVLFRMHQITGSVTIDGVDTKSIPLHDLRRNISIIPQEAIAFIGSIRHNLDPFSDYSDDRLWEVLAE
ncbi:unnamed protein product, partial [Medioppia subpectinata]